MDIKPSIKKNVACAKIKWPKLRAREGKHKTAEQGQNIFSVGIVGRRKYNQLMTKCLHNDILFLLNTMETMSRIKGI